MENERFLSNLKILIKETKKDIDKKNVYHFLCSIEALFKYNTKINGFTPKEAHDAVTKNYAVILNNQTNIFAMLAFSLKGMVDMFSLGEPMTPDNTKKLLKTIDKELNRFNDGDDDTYSLKDVDFNKMSHSDIVEYFGMNSKIENYIDSLFFVSASLFVSVNNDRYRLNDKHFSMLSNHGKNFVINYLNEKRTPDNSGYFDLIYHLLIQSKRFWKFNEFLMDANKNL